MKKALVILKDGALVEVEYHEIEEPIRFLANSRFVNFGQDTFACDTIARIRWID